MSFNAGIPIFMLASYLNLERKECNIHLHIPHLKLRARVLCADHHTQRDNRRDRKRNSGEEAEDILDAHEGGVHLDS